jgi:DNA polymerase III subunit gamma/tau
MGQALYRKHRPKKLSEVVGQEHITKTLEQALQQGRISHAYLFTGPRGVGKTSIARILAHEVNQLPYDDDSPHIDIIEIDAASNRRIDEIRELRDKVNVAPTSATYKVYIIDEVHMLTREAFNALLKTLEEPPAHVVFILATTDAHKLPATIVSRTQRFSFKPVAKDAVAAHLAELAKQEKIKVSPEALQLLAEHGEGSFRDSISLLDQAGATDTEVGVDDVQQLLGIPPAEAVQGLADSLAGTASAAQLIGNLTALYDQGYQAAAIAKQLAQTVRSQLLAGQTSLPASQALQLLDQLIQVPGSRDPERFLEIVLLENRRSDGQGSVREVTASKVRPQPVAEQAPASKPTVQPPKPGKSAQSNEVTAKTSKQPAKKSSRPLDAAVWPEVLAALKQKHNTLYGVVRMAQPTFRDDGAIELAFAFAFHQKRLNEAGNRQKLTETIRDLSGQDVVVECVLDKKTAPPSTPAVPVEPSEDMAAISNIFGGGELLES